ncbi:MAG: hypothetical protein GY941_02705 [Planctomycetes bacterium]|nr:hypothetical protein [Planctomycetota bacterium]
MNRLKLYILSTVSLLSTVPWFFFKTTDTQILGLPCWAFYSVCMTIVYAFVIALIFYRYWDILAGSEEDETIC